MYWSSFRAFLGRLVDDQITIEEVVIYAIVGGAVIGIIATSIEFIRGRIREDEPPRQRLRTWQRRRITKALEDPH